MGTEIILIERKRNLGIIRIISVPSVTNGGRSLVTSLFTTFITRDCKERVMGADFISEKR